MNLENIFLNDIEKINEWLINIRRELHSHPELDFNLPETVKIICTALDEMNIPYKTGIGKSGVVGEIQGKDKNIMIAFRADMDALPILENTDCSYSSKNKGCMHACGHDAHTAVLLGTAKILSEKREELPCNVRFIFQPAEETSGGAEPMIQDGCLENVNAIFGLHVDPMIEAGKIAVKYGAMNASSTYVDIKIKGKSCHGAYPSEGTDAVLAAAHVITAVQSIVSRNIDSRDSVVITFGIIQGGEKENIVAEEVICRGTMRTLSSETKAEAKKRLEMIVKNVSEGFGAEGEVSFRDSYTALVNHDEYVDIIKCGGENLLGKENVVEKKVSDMGVEDFAYYLEKIPGAFFNLGVKNTEKGITAPLHNGKFNIDEEALLIGVKMQVLNAVSAYNLLKLK